jgi:hypothetical protein
MYTCTCTDSSSLHHNWSTSSVKCDRVYRRARVPYVTHQAYTSLYFLQQCAATSTRLQRRAADNRQTLSQQNDYKLEAILTIKPQPTDNIAQPASRDDPLPSVAAGRASARISAHTCTAGLTGSDNICVQTQVGIAILIIFVVVCIVSLLITAYVCWRAQTEHLSKAQSDMSGTSSRGRLAYRFGTGARVHTHTHTICRLLHAFVDTVTSHESCVAAQPADGQQRVHATSTSRGHWQDRRC